MKYNAWTTALASAGVISLASVAQAEEAQNPLLTAVSSTTLSGYVDTSAIWKVGSGNDLMPGRAFDGSDKMDGFNLNVVGLSLEKPLGEESWAAGYRVDLLFGPDAIGYNPSAGLESDSELAIKQAYVDVMFPAGNGLEMKMGVWNTIIGYEVFESYQNPTYSRSFGWQLEPTQHTGLLLNYQLTEGVGVSGGVANTWYWGVNNRSPRGETDKSWMLSLSLEAPDSWGSMSGSSLYAGVVEGFGNNTYDRGDTNPGYKNTVSAYVGGSLLTPVDGLAIGAAFDYRFDGQTITPAGGTYPLTGPDNWAYAVAGYVTFAASEKWNLALRADWTSGSDGTWFDAGTPGISDQHNRLFALTATADYALWANVLTRFEMRWDRSLTDDSPYGGEWDSNNDRWSKDPDGAAFTLAANLVFVF